MNTYKHHRFPADIISYAVPKALAALMGQALPKALAALMGQALPKGLAALMGQAQRFLGVHAALQEAGFTFEFPDLDSALADIL